jgi:hypothetical protein
MESMNPKLIVLLSLTCLILIVKACTLWNDKPDLPASSDERTRIAEMEKEKRAMQLQYETTIARKEKENDSLTVVAEAKKKTLAAYRFKASYLQVQLQELLKTADSTHTVPDSLPAIASEYFTAENKNDTACTETIYSLEQVVANRDSTIIVFRQSETNLKDIQKDQQQRIELLTQELDTAYKVQKKKNRQHKLLSGALVFLTGLSTSLIVSQSLK